MNEHIGTFITAPCFFDYICNTDICNKEFHMVINCQGQNFTHNFSHASLINLFYRYLLILKNPSSEFAWRTSSLSCRPGQWLFCGAVSSIFVQSGPSCAGRPSWGSFSRVSAANTRLTAAQRNKIVLEIPSFAKQCKRSAQYSQMFYSWWKQLILR